MAFKLNYLRVTIVQVAPSECCIYGKCEKKHLKSNLNIKGKQYYIECMRERKSSEQKKNNKIIAIQHFADPINTFYGRSDKMITTDIETSVKKCAHAIKDAQKRK